ncbi:DUF4395 domain-containing protein [Candidatus Thioglobus sp.]|uniref:DUF4395 domain-containing protein n=1 Tax=Candidatus Thioglobus sp. TaxID=2026721 RepID=UPI003D14F375
MLEKLKNTFKNLWFRDPNEEVIYIDELTMRVRAGILLIIPIYMVFTLVDVVFGPTWSVVANTTTIDTYETDWDDNIIYQVEAVKRVFDYTFQTWLLSYALLEMLLGMFVITARFSPTVLIASLLTMGKERVWKPIVPKRFAWGLGFSFISVCIVFFNPDYFAIKINGVLGTGIPTDYNYIPYWLPLNLVWMCVLMMWLESVLGFCVGCKIHAGLVKIGWIEEACEACNDIDWDEIRRKKQQRLNEKDKE